ncbi:MAG TPA: hypothetical protein VME69_14705 [Methylocella sp.]|nr:hypothetical protein [Methylocella sp.]
MPYFGVVFADRSKADGRQLLGGVIVVADMVSEAFEKARITSLPTLEVLWKAGQVPGGNVEARASMFGEDARVPDDWLDRFLSMDMMFDAARPMPYQPA